MKIYFFKVLIIFLLFYFFFGDFFLVKNKIKKILLKLNTITELIKSKKKRIRTFAVGFGNQHSAN